MLQARSVRVIVEHQSTVFWSFSASERRRSHPRVQGTEMIMQTIQILKHKQIRLKHKIEKLEISPEEKESPISYFVSSNNSCVTWCPLT